MQDDSIVPPEGTRPPDDPRYPPQSVLRPEVRRSAVLTFVGGITVLFVIIGFGMLYWTLRGDPRRVEPSDPQAVGTVGSAPGGHPRSPGGFDPESRPDNTREELERRGVRFGAQGQAALVGGAPFTELRAIVGQDAGSVAGQRVNLRNVNVESGNAQSFWIRDGDARVAVVAPESTAPIRTGSRVDVHGIAEPDGSGGVRIRASSIEVR